MHWWLSAAARREWLADGLIQLTGLAASLLGLAALAVLARDGTALAAVAVYGASLVAMFAFSLLNAAARGGRRTIRALDHAAIYLLIAGTYTPFCLLVLGGAAGRRLLAAVWGLAAIGMVVGTLFPHRLERLKVALYVLLGWCCLIEVDRFGPRLSAAAVLWLAGGLIYTLGAPVHRWRALRYHDAIWHGCVLVAAGCHFAAVALAVTSA